MAAAAPRVDPRLLDLLGSLAETSATPAEIRRALVAHGREHGIPPPSYEHVRRLVSAAREERQLALALDPSTTIVPLVLRVAVGAEHGNELLRVARGGKRRTR